jgi:hypothetical protein
MSRAWNRDEVMTIYSKNVGDCPPDIQKQLNEMLLGIVTVMPKGLELWLVEHSATQEGEYTPTNPPQVFNYLPDSESANIRPTTKEEKES